jgi:hypothetical protein
MKDYVHVTNRRRPRLSRTEIKERSTIKQLLIGAIAVVLMSAMFAVVIIEMAVGCGEPIYHADGTYVTGECVFIPYTPVSGKW